MTRSPSSTVDAVWPSIAVFTAAAKSLAVKPNCSISAYFTRIRNEGPDRVADHALYVRDPDGALLELTTSPLPSR